MKMKLYENNQFFTKFTQLNDFFGGFSLGTLNIIASRPAMGKTALLCNLALDFALQNQNCFYFSFSESDELLAHKMVAIQAEVNLDHSFSNFIPEEHQRMIKVVNQNLPIMISSDLKNFYKDICEKKNQIIFIDYLQLIDEDNGKSINQLKNVSIKNNLCLFVASQLSRKVDERQGHRPKITDLFDSSQIEAAADSIIFLLRREYYETLDKPGNAELIIAKNHYGNTGNVHLDFDKEKQIFKNSIYKPIVDLFGGRELF